MTHLFKAMIAAPFLVAGLAPLSAAAMPCDGVDLTLREAVQEVLVGAEDPAISGWAKYLN